MYITYRILEKFSRFKIFEDRSVLQIDFQGWPYVAITDNNRTSEVEFQGCKHINSRIILP